MDNNANVSDHATDPDGPVDPVPVDLRDYIEFDLDRPAGRRVYATDVLAVDLICLEPGQDIGARTFPGADVVYTVLGGRAWIVTDEAEVTLDPLHAVLIPAAIPHGLRNDSADPLILQAIASPPDELPVGALGPAAQPDRRTHAPPRPGIRDRLRRVLGGPSGRG